ncbi:MAG: aminopeptidase P family protein [Actinobacteria bacterium]|nr:aminopeptidase P family protein [Actinomycetota bacterium]
MKNRVKSIASLLNKKELDGFIVTKIENVAYLSGFSGSSAIIVITHSESTLLTDSRYAEQAELECPDQEIKIYTKDIAEETGKLLPAGEIAFENTISFDLYSRLKKTLPEESSLRPLCGAIEGLRMIKEAVEIETIRRAVEFAEKGFNQVLPLIKAGTSERKLAAELDYRMVLAGADACAFETIVASGPNSSKPHAGITDRVLREGDLVVVDFGAEAGGYRSDTTRTIKVPPTSDRENEAYLAVDQAVKRALESIRPRIKASSADKAARDYLNEKGYGDNFTHSLGHGVGLEAHEKPTLSTRSVETLGPGTVFTIEPGVYVPGSFGVRIEEMVLMTESGPELLTGGIHYSNAER